MGLVWRAGFAAAFATVAGDLPAQIERGQATTAGFAADGEIRYWTMGDGEALVLIHGLFGDADVWREFAPLDHLATEWRIVAIDLRGHGESLKPRSPDAYGRTLANDVIAVLDHLGIQRAHVLGYSYGGLVVGALLASHPERLASAMLGGASRVRPNTLADVAWALDLADRLEGEGGAEWLAASLSSGDPKQDAQQRTLIARRIAGADLGAMAAVLRSTEKLAVSDETLRSNTVPLLALVGELDPNRDEVLDMARDTRGMEVAIIPGADHVAAPRTDFFWAAVMDWLRTRSGDRNDE